MPRWSQWAVNRTASDFSAGSLPSTMPMTLRVTIFCVVVGMCPLMRTPSGIALKPRGVGLLERFVHGQPDRREQLVAGLRRQPAGERQGRAAGLALDLAALELLDDRVRIAGRLVGVDDEHRLGAAAGRFLVLVGPAAVVGERLAAEEFRIVRRRLVGEDDDDFALHVDVLVIVPAELGGGDAVAEEDRLGVEVLRLLRLAGAGEFVFQLERGGLAALDEGERRLGPGGHHHERDGLEERAAVAGRLEPRLLELLRDVLDRQLLAAAADAAALRVARWRGTSRRRECARWRSPAPRSAGRTGLRADRYSQGEQGNEDCIAMAAYHEVPR